jgi:hypothetical protein
MSIQEGIELNISSASWVSGYALEITFSDGVSHKVDFGPFLKGSVRPDVRKYLDLDRFKGFSISFGNLSWNDYDLCFPIEDLYSGEIIAQGVSDRMVAEDPVEYRVDSTINN